jgi:molybdopterin synthase catalytic subunit
MEVQVRFFATLREVAGAAEMKVSLGEGATVATLLDRLRAKFPTLERHLPTLLVAVNREFQGPDHPLGEGDEVALMPPVSGGMDRTAVREGPLAVGPLIDALRRPDCGAIAVFIGSVRADPGVHGLEYEAYDEMALEKMGTIRRRAMEKFAIMDMAIHHRRGRLRVGEDSVIIVATGGHRSEAFEACRWAMEELKVTVPIWKVRALGPGEGKADRPAYEDRRSVG